MMATHLKRDHGVKAEALAKDFDALVTSEKAHHECKLCGSSLWHTLNGLNVHMKDQHQVPNIFLTCSRCHNFLRFLPIFGEKNVCFFQKPMLYFLQKLAVV
jgi:RNase P subunit RPR2